VENSGNPAVCKALAARPSPAHYCSRIWQPSPQTQPSARDGWSCPCTRLCHRCATTFCRSKTKVCHTHNMLIGLIRGFRTANSESFAAHSCTSRSLRRPMRSTEFFPTSAATGECHYSNRDLLIATMLGQQFGQQDLLGHSNQNVYYNMPATPGSGSLSSPAVEEEDHSALQPGASIVKKEGELCHP
jgi:hypothetical protein